MQQLSDHFGLIFYSNQLTQEDESEDLVKFLRIDSNVNFSTDVFVPKGSKSTIHKYLELILSDDMRKYTKAIRGTARGTSLLETLEVSGGACIWCGRKIDQLHRDECVCTIRKKYPTLPFSASTELLHTPLMCRSVAPLFGGIDGVILEDMLMLETSLQKTNAELTTLPGCNFLTLNTSSVSFTIASRGDGRNPSIPRIPPLFIVQDPDPFPQLTVFITYPVHDRWDNQRCFTSATTMEVLANLNTSGKKQTQDMEWLNWRTAVSRLSACSRVCMSDSTTPIDRRERTVPVNRCRCT